MPTLSKIQASTAHPTQKFIADVTLVTGAKVRAIVLGKNLFHAAKTLSNIYGVSNVGIVREYASVHRNENIK
jgi:putative ubiquitin-RnfH superfamily antitoxin RatB of RatAB toxin-antitoxin module